MNWAQITGGPGGVLRQSIGCQIGRRTVASSSPVGASGSAPRPGLSLTTYDYSHAVDEHDLCPGSTWAGHKDNAKPTASIVKPFLPRFFLFGIAGTLGFLVDSLVLYMIKAALGLYLARAVSFLAATCATWTFNRRITFADRRTGLPPHHEFARYVPMVMGGGGVNLGLYALLVSLYPFVAHHPVLGVAAGGFAGMCVNFVLVKSLLFRRAPVER